MNTKIEEKGLFMKHEWIIDTLNLRLHLVLQVEMCISQFEAMCVSPGIGMSFEL